MIYFIGSGKTGPVKIGFTSRRDGVQDRLSSLQTGNPEELSVLAVIEGSQKGESQIHKALAANRLKGEWFEREPALAILTALVSAEVGGIETTLPDLTVSRLSGNGAWTGKLSLYWEPNGSPMSDDYLPSEISAQELWLKWRRDYVPDNGVVPIYWFVHGGGFLEAAPFGNTGPDRIPFIGDFYSHFAHPVDDSNTPIEWLSLPVIDKAWNNRQADKGGFIQELTGWKPSPLQQTMDVDLIYEAWATNSHKTARGGNVRNAKRQPLMTAKELERAQ